MVLGLISYAAEERAPVSPVTAFLVVTSTSHLYLSCSCLYVRYVKVLTYLLCLNILLIIPQDVVCSGPSALSHGPAEAVGSRSRCPVSPSSRLTRPKQRGTAGRCVERNFSHRKWLPKGNKRAAYFQPKCSSYFVTDRGEFCYVVLFFCVNIQQA